MFLGLLQWSEALGRRDHDREEEKRGGDQGTLSVGFDAGRGQNCSGPGGRHVAHIGEAWPQWAGMQRRAAWRVLGTMGCNGFLPTDRQAVESTEEGVGSG